MPPTVRLDRTKAAVPLLVTVKVTGLAAILTTDDKVKLLLLMANAGAVVAGPESATAIGLLVGVGSVPVPASVMSALALLVLLARASAGVNE